MQVLNGILGTAKKEPDLLESHIQHRLFVQCHVYPSFTHFVSVSFYIRTTLGTLLTAH